MTRRIDLRALLLAGACFGLGFVVADRMAPATASPAAAAQDANGAAFGGADGAVVLRSQLYVIRGKKVYRIDPGSAGTQRPWGELVE